METTKDKATSRSGATGLTGSNASSAVEDKVKSDAADAKQAVKQKANEAAETTAPVAAKQPASAATQINNGRDSIAELIRQLANDISTLTSKEMSLAKAEFREAATTAKAGIGGIAGGAGIALAGALFIMLSITYGLAEVMPPWAAALTVGVIAIIIGVVMMNAGKKNVEPG